MGSFKEKGIIFCLFGGVPMPIFGVGSKPGKYHSGGVRGNSVCLVQIEREFRRSDARYNYE